MSTPAIYNRKNPFPARLKRLEVLTKPGSGKDTRHFEISLAGSGIQYEPGDSLAVQPLNDPDLVKEIIDVLGLTGEELVGDEGSQTTLYNALLKEYSITQPDPKLLKAIAANSPASAFGHLLDRERKEDLEKYLWGREVIDLLMEHPEARFGAAEFVKLLRKLQVRLYSISSSLKSTPEEVHLTVATVEYETFGRKRQGVCSAWLAYRLNEDSIIPCFITPNNKFRVPPAGDETPIIMVGPGTGVAPFRAFVEERKATGAKSPAWLFFGEQHQASEFFYEEEWNAALASGALTKLTTAFSRDQAHKIYVQHQMLNEGQELWEWLEKGAIFYVCGDKTRMAADVDAALHEVVHRFGGKTVEEAAEYVEEMKKHHRYHRDVY